MRKKRAITTENTESTEAFFKVILRALCGKKLFRNSLLVEVG